VPKGDERRAIQFTGYAREIRIEERKREREKERERCRCTACSVRRNVKLDNNSTSSLDLLAHSRPPAIRFTADSLLSPYFSYYVGKLENYETAFIWIQILSSQSDEFYVAIAGCDFRSTR